MSKTFRRSNGSTAGFFNITEKDVVEQDGKFYRVFNGGLVSRYFMRDARGSTVAEVVRNYNNRYFTDNHDSYSPPSNFRKLINRSERRRVAEELHHAIVNGEEDDFVDFRAKLPYWD